MRMSDHRDEPRLFGVVPPLATLGLGLVALVLGAVALATSHWLLGLVLMALAVALNALFLETARRFRPHDPASRATVGLSERARDWSGFAAGSAGAWSRAGRELLAARRELRGIGRELVRTQLELGGAAYRGDADETERLRERMRQLEERARERGLRTHRAVDEARQRVDEERLAIQPTEVVRLDREDVP